MAPKRKRLNVDTVPRGGIESTADDTDHSIRNEAPMEALREPAVDEKNAALDLSESNVVAGSGVPGVDRRGDLVSSGSSAVENIDDDERRDVLYLILKESNVGAVENTTQPAKKLLEKGETLPLLEYVPYHEFLTLQEDHNDLKSRVKQLEEEMKGWRSRETNTTPSVESLDPVGSPQKQNFTDKNTFMRKTMSVLGLDEYEIFQCHENSAKGTARSLIKKIFANCEPDFTFSKINKKVIDTIIVYSKHANPNDTASSSEIRKSMNNCFTGLHRKKKSGESPEAEEVNENK